jgi:hypothetical protein
MAEHPRFTFIALELDLGFGYARMAKTAYSAGRTAKGDAALQTAWSAWEQAAGLILKDEVEELRPRLLELEALLWGVEARPAN